MDVRFAGDEKPCVRIYKSSGCSCYSGVPEFPPETRPPNGARRPEPAVIVSKF